MTPDRDIGAASTGLGLSLRLALVYAVLFTAAALALFVLVFFLVSAALEQQELDAVRDRVREYRAWYLEGGARALQDRFDEQSRNTSDVLFIHLMAPDGSESLIYSGPTAGRDITPEKLRALPPGIHRPRIKLGSGNDISSRWTVVTAELPNRTIMHAGKSALYLDATLDRFRRLFLLIVIPSLLIGIALSTLIAFRGLQPIRKLIATMERNLRTGDLSRRAPAGKRRDELSRLGALFNRLLDRNESLVHTTRESLDAVAHDLRTPMTRLRNVAEAALENDDRAHTREALATCLEESDQALTLLRSLTEIAEAETGAMNLNRETILVADLARQVSDLYEFVAAEREIVIDTGEIPEDLALEADRPRLQQVLANLVDNAVKYSPDHSTVAIAAHARPASDEIVITVADEGPGIPENDQPQIFNRLYRGDASRSQTPGLGLGLSLVRAVVEAHGGRVSVDARTGAGDRDGDDKARGSVFSVFLPAAPPAPA